MEKSNYFSSKKPTCNQEQVSIYAATSNRKLCNPKFTISRLPWKSFSTGIEFIKRKKGDLVFVIMKFKPSKSLGFEQRQRQDRKVVFPWRIERVIWTSKKKQMEFLFPVNRNILFINPILKQVLKGYKCFSLYTEGAQAKAYKCLYGL